MIYVDMCTSYLLTNFDELEFGTGEKSNIEKFLPIRMNALGFEVYAYS